MSASPWSAGPLGPMLAEAIAEGARRGAFLDASVEVRLAGQTVGAAVLAQPGPPGLHPRDLRWDLASLTKPRGLGTLAMRAVAAGSLDLDAPVDPSLPGHLTPRALLGHRAGLPAFYPWAATTLPPGLAPGSAATRLALTALIRHVALQSAQDLRAGPPPARYSDVGFMLLARHFEARFGPLRRLIPGYRPIGPRRDAARFVACGLCPLRGRVLRGEVHDPQAWAEGGASGHAGLFATTRSVAAWADGLRACADGAPTPSRGPTSGISGDVVRHFWRDGAPLDGSTWRLAWDTPSAEGSSAGTTVGSDAVGHLGFTGTSVWIEPSRGLVTVLLTNRVALGDEAQPAMRSFRPRLHDAVRAAASALS
jgi:CubicO group peptidase (beta-lactamase class C family)